MTKNKQQQANKQKNSEVPKKSPQTIIIDYSLIVRIGNKTRQISPNCI